MSTINIVLWKHFSIYCRYICKCRMCLKCFGSFFLLFAHLLTIKHLFKYLEIGIMMLIQHMNVKIKSKHFISSIFPFEMFRTSFCFLILSKHIFDVYDFNWFEWRKNVDPNTNAFNFILLWCLKTKEPCIKGDRSLRNTTRQNISP